MLLESPGRPHWLVSDHELPSKTWSLTSEKPLVLVGVPVLRGLRDFCFLNSCSSIVWKHSNPGDKDLVPTDMYKDNSFYWE